MLLFSESIANLFYAIACADKKISSNELAFINEIIAKEWTTSEFIMLNKNSDFEMHFHDAIKKLIEQNRKPHDCFTNFEAFKKLNDAHFSQSLKNLIWKTAESIASTNNSKNKSELIMLSKLAIVLS